MAPGVDRFARVEKVHANSQGVSLVGPVRGRIILLRLKNDAATRTKSLAPDTREKGAGETTISALRPAQQPQGIGDDDESGADVGGDGHPEVGQAEEGQDQDNGLGEEREVDVLADAGKRGAAVANQPGKAAEVVTHEDDVGGLKRGTAGNSAQGDAHAG